MRLFVILVCLLTLKAFAEPQPEVLSREATSSNTSELFAKVLTLEEHMRDITGKLQSYEHENKILSQKLNSLLAKEPAATQAPQPVSSTQMGDEKLLQAIQLIENKNYDQALAQLNELSDSSHLKASSKGDVFYYQGKAYLGKKDNATASSYFAKSYRYFLDIKSNDVLFKLIETLVLEKKYSDSCSLLKKLSDKYVKALNADRKQYISNLENTHCK